MAFEVFDGCYVGKWFLSTSEDITVDLCGDAKGYALVRIGDAFARIPVAALASLLDQHRRLWPNADMTPDRTGER